MMRIRKNFIIGSFLLIGFTFLIYNERQQLIISSLEINNALDNVQIRYIEEIQNTTPSQECPLQLRHPSKVDVQMLQVLDEVTFDNIDGGAWTQGWEIEVSEDSFSDVYKLKVFVVPHSHNDPGWMKTAEEYFNLYTHDILDNMLQKLAQDKRRTFIWAEILYFSMWWETLSDNKKKEVKRLVDDNQLEFVTGGWVMNDEANSYWVSTVEQFIEGHQWLKQHLNYTPKTSWSIDPFGLSSTQAALLNKMGFENMVIQRVHYSVKKYLAQAKQLEFNWRQIWDNLGNTDMFAHVMPFSFYDTLHTCGPDPHICCQFDFSRILTNDHDCPDNFLPQNVTDQNVAERAELLLDQYRKKSTLFRTNTLLVTLGDDFRFNTAAEWDLQYENYQKIFDYLNANKHLNTQIKFGTLSDYFKAVKNDKFKPHFPTLSGDFFSYADRDDHFWTGTYTSKQYFKRLDRVLLSYIRAVDVALIKTRTQQQKSSTLEFRLGKMNKGILHAKKVLALFQHHDGLSGTANNEVIYDYGKKMLSAIEQSQQIIQELAKILLHIETSFTSEKVVNYKIDDLVDFNNIGKHYPVEINEQSTRRVVIFNPLAFARFEVVTFMVTMPFIEVLDYDYNHVECQISPVFDHENGSTHNAKYYVSFVANVPAFGMSTYFFNGVPRSTVPKKTTFSRVLCYNYNKIMSSSDRLTFENLTTIEEFVLKNDRITASFGKLGLLKAIHLGSKVVPVELEFTKYHNRISSGHLFLPENSAVLLKPPKIKLAIIQGPILSSVTTQFPYVTHSATLYNSPGVDDLGIEIQNIVNITDKTNFELMMRLTTNITTNGEFFTDSNGYQLLKRKYLSKLPIQGNFYPMPTMSYIEDQDFRLSILTDTPVGVASLCEGQIEVTLDQRNKPFNKSLTLEAINDKTPITHTFRLLLEMKNHRCKTILPDNPAGINTISTYLNQQALLNPLLRLISTGYDAPDLKTLFGSFDIQLPLDYSIVLLRNDVQMNENSYTGLILHRQYFDECYIDELQLQQFSTNENSVNIGNFFNLTSKFNEASLSLTKIGKELDIWEDISLCPMDIQAYVLQLT